MNNSGKIISKLFRGTVASIIAATVAAMIGIVIDGVITSRFLGEDGMAAYTLVMPVVNLATAFSGILATGAQVVCAHHLGAGRKRRARKAFTACMIITVTVSVILMLVILFFRDPICIMLGAKTDTLLRGSSDYLLGVMFTLPSVLFLFEFNSLMRLDGDANRVIVAVVVMTVLDIVGDLLNVLVIHGGLLGMGLATSISYGIGLVIMFLHFTKKDIIFHLYFRGMRMKDIIEIFVTGSSSGVGSASAMLRVAAINQILVGITSAAMASTVLAAFGVVNTVINLLSSVMVGIGMTCSTITGLMIGEKDRNAMLELVKVTVKTALIFGVVIGVVVFVGADGIAMIFQGDSSADMVPIAARGLRFYAFAIIIYGINNAFVNYTQGLRRMVISNIYCFLQNFVFVIVPALALSGMIKNPDAVWISLIIAEVLTLIAIYCLAAYYKKGLPRSFNDFLFIEEPFGVAPENTLVFSIETQDAVVPASESVKEFCTERGASDKQAYLMSLFVEELSNNVIEHGFSDGKKHSIDFRVMNTDDGWVLRYRDNCKLFDPMEWLKLHETDEPGENIGIRMIAGMAEDVKYLSTMDLNNLTIYL
ncbi:MAG: ATP-binding protein [Ruminococcus sp.]|nr:ATP-binding protein [Ruminococcus sp.]